MLGSVDSNTIQSTEDINPANGEIVGRVVDSDLSNFAQRMDIARKAQAQWASQSFKTRAKHIKKMQRYIVEHADELATIISRSNGKTRTDAMATEVLPSALSCQWYAKHAAKVLAPKARKIDSILFFNKRTQMQHLPLGVVGIISPWNYPLSIPFGEVVMGLMAGNAVILKSAAATLSVGQAIDKIVAAGELPEGLFQQVYGSGGAVSEAMLTHGIDKLFFTGSVGVGKQLMAKAAETLTPVSLELGGNDPMIVLEDADLERAANGAIWAGFQNAGQSCGGVERIYVHEAVYQPFLMRLIEKTKALRHGYRDDHDVDIGSVTTAGQLHTIEAHVHEALEKGAQIAARSTPCGEQDGYFFPATVMVNTTPNMRLIQEETFGPVLPVMHFHHIDEAIEMANQSDLALTSSVWTKDLKKGQAIAARLQTGVTTINDHLYTHGLSEMPWGGWKQSGIGRTHGPEGLLEMTHVKAINWDILPGKRNLWWHPFDEQTYQALHHAMQFVFAPSLMRRLNAGIRLAPVLLRKMFKR